MPEKPYRDEYVIRELYVNQKRSASEVGRILDCSKDTVSKYCDEFGIERRGVAEASRLANMKLPHVRTTPHGYESVQDGFFGGNNRVYIHRLLAVAEFGFDKVCGSVVHHVNGVPWDNREENIEVHTNSDHASMHQGHDPRHETPPWKDEETLRQEYSEKRRTSTELAEDWGCTYKNIIYWLREYNIPVRTRGKQAKHLPEDELDELYNGENLTMAEVAEVFDTTRKVVSKNLHRTGLR